MFEVIWEKNAVKDLRALDKSVAKRIIDKVETYLRVDPVNIGKPLGNKFSGLFSFRFNNYRVIYNIKRDQLIIRVIKVGHRKDVYE